MGQIPISSNHLSHDEQVLDALAWLVEQSPSDYRAIVAEFPELIGATFNGSWFNTYAMGVDPEWAHWLADALIATGWVVWEDGEPWACLPGLD